jgi:hypothetical protein
MSYDDEVYNVSNLIQGRAKFDEDFVGTSWSATAGYATWLATVNGGSFANTTGIGGRGLLTSQASDDSQCNLQVNGAAFQLSTYPVKFQSRFSLDSTVAQTGAFVGLAITDTTILTTDAGNAVTDSVGFLFDGTNVRCVNGKTASSSWTAAATCQNDIVYLPGTTAFLPVTTVVHDYGFEYNGKGTLDFYVDGAKVATHIDKGSAKTYFPDVLFLTPTLVVQSLNGSAQTLNMDAVRVFIGGFRDTQ